MHTISEINLLHEYQRVRAYTEFICSSLKAEDFVVQSMEDVSPTKWHLAHTSWFFETFLLCEAILNYQRYHPQYHHLFNSYYKLVGDPFSRPDRGLLSRPTVEEVYEYRKHIDQQMQRWFENASSQELDQYASIIELGINHEQQHQELILTDIKHVLSINPLKPVFRETPAPSQSSHSDLEWIDIPEGIYEIGFEGDGFSFDNEGPRHRTFIEPVKIASRLVTNKEYMEFIDDGSYQQIDLWLSEAWETINQQKWQTPIYWCKQDGVWYQFTLSGLREIDPNEPVCHISYYEADAFSRWAGARLPTEFEWEAVAGHIAIQGNLLEQENFHPIPLSVNSNGSNLHQLYGDVWEWTQSAYSPYPGFRPQAGALGEYNGKWMCNQYVLRGGSCVTPQSHIRKTYRNFFPAHSRWQFMGIRLLKDQKS